MSICELTTRELVFIGFDNELTLIPLTNESTGARMDMSGVTQVDICVGGIEASSTTSPTQIMWEQQTIEGVLTWVIVLRAGLVSGVVPGEQELRVIVYDGDYPDGLVVTHDFPIEAVADC